MQNSSLLQQLSNLTIKSVLVFIGVIETIWLMFHPAVRDGLDVMFLLPAVFTLCLLLFGKIIEYKGIGLKVYYIIAVLRYIVQPFLIVISEGAVSSTRMSNVNASYYRIAIFIQCIEIIIACATISHKYPQYWEKEQLKYEEEKAGINGEVVRNDVLGFGGFVILTGFIGVLLLRINIWLPALNIYGIKESTRSGIVLENSLFSAAKTIVFLVFVNRATKSTGKSRITYIILSILMLLFNVMSYMGSNRSMTIEIVVASLILILYHFPEHRRLILSVSIPVAAAVVVSMFITKQFSADTVSEVTEMNLSVQYFSNQLEEYTNGPWCVAQSYAASIGLSITERFQATVKEVLDGLMVLFEIPGLKGLNDFATEWMSTSDVMKFSFQTVDRAQMLSFSGGYFINFGSLGWIVMPVATYIVISLLTKFSVKAEFSGDDILMQYIYIWSSCLFGLTHCYCTQTLIYCMTKYIFFLWLIKLGNRVRARVGDVVW